MALSLKTRPLGITDNILPIVTGKDIVYKKHYATLKGTPLW